MKLYTQRLRTEQEQTGGGTVCQMKKQPQVLPSLGCARRATRFSLTKTSVPDRVLFWQRRAFNSRRLAVSDRPRFVSINRLARRQLGVLCEETRYFELGRCPMWKRHRGQRPRGVAQRYRWDSKTPNFKASLITTRFLENDMEKNTPFKKKNSAWVKLFPFFLQYET